MEQKIKQKGLINLLALLLVGVAAYAAAKHGNTLAGPVACVFLGIGVLVALVSWFQIRLEEREHLERLEFEELSKSAASSALFTASESEALPAQRSREQFERFFVPAFTVLVFLLQAGGGILLWRWLNQTIPTPLQNQEVVAALFAMLGLLLFVLGKFSTTVARLAGLRLLRPGASYLLLGAFLSWLVCAGIIATWAGSAKVDLYLARALCVVLILIGLETLITLVLEVYRPRVKGKVERTIYESRLVSLLGQPEGIITTAAHTIDYQFGFKVSETWAFATFKQWMPAVLAGQAAVLLLSSCFVFIEPGQQGLFEHFGKPVAGHEVLGPGPHLKLPWPIDQVLRFPTERIQSFIVGAFPDPLSLNQKTILWTVKHATEVNFLVANRGVTAPASATNNASGRRPPPVSLLTVSIPVQYQINDLAAWAYNNEDPSALLEDLATREVVRYFVGVDFQDIMSRSLGSAAEVLRSRMQAEADRLRLGAKITVVGLQDIHPPTAVAADYEKVVAALHTKEAAILAARAEEVKTNNLAAAAAFRIEHEAEAEKERLQVEALARAALFTSQLPAYRASPSVYAQRAYLQTFARSVADARKYILLTTNTHDVFILNLEDKYREDYLQSVTVPPPKPK